MLAFINGRWADEQGVGGRREAMEAAFNVLAFERGLTPEALRARVSVADQLNHELSQQVDNAKDVGKASVAAQQELLKQMVQSRADHESIQATEAGQFKKGISDGIEKSKAEFDAFRRTVLDQITLQAPVTYWEKRAASMRWSAGAWAAIFVIGFAVVVWQFIGYARPLLSEKLELPQRLWTITILLAILGFASWPLRILARLFMSAIHLRADSLERRTMVLTYLALLKEDAVESKHREIVLAALFRPSPTGIVSDDGAPSAFAEVLKAIKPGS